MDKQRLQPGNMDRITKMTSSSLDWSIQSALSSLYPPFEATAPTVLSQLFRTIEERYQGDALQCFVDYLIPAKHILESVQQAACAEYSGVLFRCEGWPLCLRERVVIQLSPINPLLLRPGDFYLQVEPFGEQSARIVLKSLLQEDILAQEDSVLLPGYRAQEGPAVEETPIPETSYPCIFTDLWLKEINDDRPGNQLHQCVLSSDQGIVKVPWAEVISPEFLDRPKSQVESKTLCTTAGLIKKDTFKFEAQVSLSDSQFSVNMPYPKTTLEPETMILSSKSGVAGSRRLVKSSNKFVNLEQRKLVNNPGGKPVGWVSPNTWDNRPSQELEGDYVDLLDFAKQKEALSFKVTVIPSVQMSFRPHSPSTKEDSTPCVQASGLFDEQCVPSSKNHLFSEDPQKGSESKGRHRQSYLAAIKNPVNFEKANIIVPLNETWPGLGEAEPNYEAQDVDLGIDSLSTSPVQGSNQLERTLMQSCQDSDKQAQNLVQINVNEIYQFQNTTPPSLNTAEQSKHFLTKQPPERPQKTVLEHIGAVNVNRQHCVAEQENPQMWTNVPKQHKIQQLPKMGLRALPDHRSHRQESGAYKCQGAGMERKIDQFVYGLVPPHKSLQQPTAQRTSLIPHPQKSRNMLQEQNSQFEQSPKCGNKKALVKSKHKARSASSVSESARECSHEDKPVSRSCSDVYPEIIPMVSGVQVQPCKKSTTFGIVSPKLDRRKAAKNALHSTGSVEPFTALQNEAVHQGSSTKLQNFFPEHGRQITALAHDPAVKNVLQLGVIYLPGSRDRAGRAVLEVHGGKNGWTSPLLSPLVFFKLFLYLHSIPRKQVRDLGLTVIINSWNGPIPSMVHKGLLMVQEQLPHAVHSVLLLVDKDQILRTDKLPGLQMDIITSLKALHKSVDGQQLTNELGGSFPYNHTDWLQFYQKLFLFGMDLQGAALLLQSAIKKLDHNKKTDTAEDVRRCSQEQKSVMKQVLEDTHMVNLQRDGGAILARMRKEECRFAQSEDYRDSVEAVMCLYNKVEEGVHTLVMRSNQSLQHLDHVLLLRETEEQLNKITEWCEEEIRRWHEYIDFGEESREILEHKLAGIHAVLTQAKERKEEAMSLMKDVELKINGTCYPETDIFRTHMTKFHSKLAAFMLQIEQRKSDLEAIICLFHFCEQAFTLTNECSHYLEHMELSCHPEMFNMGKLKSFQERFKAFTPECFEEVKSKALNQKHHRVVRLWREACSVSQEVKQRLEEKLLEIDKKQKLQRFPQREEMTLKNDEVLFETPNSSLSSSLTNVKAQSQQCDAQIETQSQDRLTRNIRTNQQQTESPSEKILTEMLTKFPREHHSEADLRNVDLFGGRERNRALGRSHSEGSCIRNFSPMLSRPPLHLCQNISASKPNVLLSDRERVAYHQDSFSSAFSNIKLEWIQMDIRDKMNVTQDDHDSTVSRQESFCSSVSSPRQGWIKEEKSSNLYLDDRNSGYPTRDPISPERLMDTLDCNSATELEHSSNLLKLQHIMEELLQTEREYVRALGYVMEHYFPELERQDVPQDLRGQKGSIFGNLEKLREFHQHHFLKELELCLRHPFRVGRCFLRHKESFGLYALYSKNKPRSDSLLINHGKEFFKQKQQLLEDKMDLSSYLLKPVQRISKYSLLLQDMLQECDTTPHKAPERAELQAALEVIQFQLRNGNNLLAMDDIQECDVNLKEQGQLIHQDEFLVFFRKKKYFRHIFLFQDLILFSKTKKTEVGNDIYIYKQSFKTSDIGMTRNCGESGLCFEIWFRRRKSQDTYILQARSYEVKEDWTNALERILWDQAIHNREIRMQERVFMGIGCKPYMDIKPSEAAICDRAINCALTGRDCKAPAFSVMSDTERGIPVQRPNSTGSSSYVSLCSHSSSSSSSGRGSVSPVCYHIGLTTRGVSMSDPGRFSNLVELDLDQENVRQNQPVDSSESSVESISGFSSSGYNFQSVIEGRNEANSLDVPEIGLGKPCPNKMEDHHQHKDKSLKPQNQTRDQPLKVQEDNHMGKSTEV